MGTDTPSNVSSQFNQGQPQSQSSPSTRPQNPGQQSPGQHKPSTQNQNPRGTNSSSASTTGKESNRSAQGGIDIDKVGSVGQGEDALDDESEDQSSAAPGSADRSRSERDRTQPR
jgi:hypothetical protein